MRDAGRSVRRRYVHNLSVQTRLIIIIIIRQGLIIFYTNAIFEYYYV